MKSIHRRLLVFVFVLASGQISAQDDLMNQLQKDSVMQSEKTIATFKGFKIVNILTPETVKKKNLDFRITHLFGNMGAESGGGIHTLYGFDQSNDIRIAFMYGITDRLNIGFSRLKRDENLVGELKFKALEQTMDSKMPITATIYTNMAYTPKEDADLTKSAYRMSYCTQVVLARKFSSHFSFELVPSYLHRNLVTPDDENDILSLGIGGRFKVTRSTAIIADYVYDLDRPELVPKRYDPIGFGIEIETGGHVFSLMFTNASGILENDYIANTVDNWADGGYKFSFHISRMFSFDKSSSGWSKPPAGK
jgi:Membrane bound beta barrel domain (DUF5777)